MKKIIFQLSKAMAGLALVITAVNVNTACHFIVHQPQLPAGAEKLSKINNK